MKIKKIQYVIFSVHMDLILELEWELKFVLAPKCIKELSFSFLKNINGSLEFTADRFGILRP